jgi:hypothetical protein
LRPTGARTGALSVCASLGLATLVVARAASAADVSEYFESAAGGKPRSNAGLVVRGDWLQLKADVALRHGSGGTQVVPNFRSTFDLGAHLDVETRVDFADRNYEGGAIGATVNTRVHYDPPAPFLEAVDGTAWKSADGQEGEALNIAFRKVISIAGRERPITIRGLAAVETTSIGALPSALPEDPGAEGSRRYRVETEVRGLIRSLSRGKSALRLKIERLAGAQVETAKSVAYDYSWTVRNVVQLGLNVGMRSATEQAVAVLEPSVGLTWRTQF